MEKKFKVTVEARVYITYDISAENEYQATRKAEFLFNDDKKDYTISSDDIRIVRDSEIIETYEPEEV